MITDYVPSAYMVHDQLHIRGGHQVSWLIDGVPVPNTNIASNVGPQFDPKDIDYLEVQRGGYSAEYGDRTYGVFNVVTRSGFERNRQAELVTSYGSFNNTNDQFSFGDHTDRFAYYGSVSGNRTDLGLETSKYRGAARSGRRAERLSLPSSLTRPRMTSCAWSLRRAAITTRFPTIPTSRTSGFATSKTSAMTCVNFSWLHTVTREPC